MQIDELFIKLFFKTDDKELKDFNKDTQGAKVNLFGVVAAATAAVVAIEKIAEATAHAVNNFQNFNAQTGLSIGKLQNLQITAQLQNIGISADDVTQSVQALQSNLAAIKLGQGNIAPFQMLGINVIGQDAFQVIDELRERIKSLDDMTATNIIQQMGLNPQMITMLRMSKDEFSDLNKEIALTYDERKNIQELGVEIRKTQLLIQGAINKAISQWSPTLKGMAEFIQNIIYAFKRLHLIIPTLVIALGGLLKMFGLLNKATLLWTAGLMALFLLLDDYATWAQGGDSLFDYSGIEQFFKSIGDGLASLGKYTDILELLLKVGNIWTGANQAGSWLGNQLGSKVNGWIEDFTNLKNPSLSYTTGNVGNNAWLGLGGSTAVALNIATQQAKNNNEASKNITQNNNITVNSSAAEATDVARSLQIPLNNATQQMINQTGGR